MFERKKPTIDDFHKLAERLSRCPFPEAQVMGRILLLEPLVIVPDKRVRCLETEWGFYDTNSAHADITRSHKLSRRMVFTESIRSLGVNVTFNMTEGQTAYWAALTMRPPHKLPTDFVYRPRVIEYDALTGEKVEKETDYAMQLARLVLEQAEVGILNSKSEEEQLAEARFANYKGYDMDELSMLADGIDLFDEPE